MLSIDKKQFDQILQIIANKYGKIIRQSGIKKSPTCVIAITEHNELFQHLSFLINEHSLDSSQVHDFIEEYNKDIDDDPEIFGQILKIELLYEPNFECDQHMLFITFNTFSVERDRDPDIYGPMDIDIII